MTPEIVAIIGPDAGYINKISRLRSLEKSIKHALRTLRALRETKAFLSPASLLCECQEEKIGCCLFLLCFRAKWSEPIPSE